MARSSTPRSWRRAWAPLLVAAIAVAAAWPAVRNGWCGVDEGLYARDWLALRSLDLENVTQRLLGPGPGWQYQSTVYLSHAIDYALFGDDVHAFHAMGVAIYALVAALTALTARAVLERVPGLSGPERTLGAFVGGALFAVHPTHVETFAWLGGRKDPLAVLFALACFLAARRARAADALAARAAWLIAAHGALVLALGAKVTVAAVFLAIAVDAACDPGVTGVRARLRRAALHAASYGVIALALGAAWVRLTHAAGFIVRVPDLGAALHLLFGARCLGAYAGRLVVPTDLALVPTAQHDAGAIAHDLGWLAVAVGATVVGLRAGGPIRVLVALGAASFFVNLAPLSTVANFYVNDRYLLFPSTALAATVGGLLVLGLRTRARPWLAAAALGALGALTVATGRYVPAWRDAGTLWAAVDRANPGNGHAATNDAIAAALRGDVAGARSALARTAAAGMVGPQTIVTVAMALERGGEPAGGDALVDEHLAKNPDLDDPQMASFRARRALLRGEAREAARLADQCLKALPMHWPTLTIAGEAHLALGDPATALLHLRRAVDIAATTESAIVAAVAAEATGDLALATRYAEMVEWEQATWSSRLVLGRVALARGDAFSALSALRDARRLLPEDDGSARNEVALALARAGSRSEAADLLRDVHARGLADATCVYNLARLEAMLGRAAVARTLLREALARDPALLERSRTDPALSAVAPGAP